MMKTFSSRCISSRIAELSASRTVSCGSPGRRLSCSATVPRVAGGGAPRATPATPDRPGRVRARGEPAGRASGAPSRRSSCGGARSAARGPSPRA
eukprot:scaffold31194_cov86-Isochrysis_galbana.AAC.2